MAITGGHIAGQTGHVDDHNLLDAALAVAGLPATVVTRTAAYTALRGDFVLADATAGPFSVTLPATPAVGSLVTVKKTDASVNAVTVLGTIDGQVNASITAQFYGGTFEYVGAAGWQVAAVPTAQPGPKGDAGATGPTGATGAKGDKGDTGAAGAGSVPLAIAYFNPGALFSFTHSGGTVSSDIDATNLAATFTVPTSGKVMVQMAASLVITAGASSTATLTLRSGTTDVQAQRVGGILTTNAQIRGHAIFYVTGLTAGAIVTYKAGVNRSDGTGDIIVYAGANVGAAYLIVSAA